jgi:hypothetical protein
MNNLAELRFDGVLEFTNISEEVKCVIFRGIYNPTKQAFEFGQEPWRKANG